jgi:hypothetical protein
MLQPLKGDEVQAALGALGSAIEELDRAAHDAGFRVRLIVMPGDQTQTMPGGSGGRAVRPRQEEPAGRDFSCVGFISYHRAGVAKRQARAAIRASRRLGGALDGVRAQNEQLIEVVDRQAAVIERLERELGDLRTRLEDR